MNDDDGDDDLDCDDDDNDDGYDAFESLNLKITTVNCSADFWE